METGFFNFHDEEQFLDFSLSLDQQHNLLGESRHSLIKMVDGDFDYVGNLELNTNDALWETEQELNGDLAVLPVSGVAGIIPKMENMKEDYAKVLTDWQEHIGYLQALEVEEDIDLVNIDMGLQINTELVDNIFGRNMKSTGPTFNSAVRLENMSNFSSSQLNNSIKFEAIHHGMNPVIESDQSENEIDVVGLDTINDVASIIDFMHVRRQHMSTPSKETLYKSLGKSVKNIKQEFFDFSVKDESVQFKQDESQIFSSPLKLDFSKCNKKNYSKKFEDKISYKKSRKSKLADETFKTTKKLKKEIPKKFMQKLTDSGNKSLTPEKMPAMLEAGDVKSLLEQFEATEAVVGTSEPNSERISPQRISCNKASCKSENTLLKKCNKSQNLKFRQDIRNSLPKEVTTITKVSGRKKMISVIPPMPNTKTRTRINCTRIQEVATTLSQNKILKLVASTSSSLIGRVDGSVQLDHDYCNNSISSIIYSSNSSSTHGCISIHSSNSSDCNSEYDRLTSDSEQLSPIKDETGIQRIDYHSKIATEISNSSYKVNSSMTVKKNWIDSNSKKDSGLDSGDLSDINEDHTLTDKVKKSLIQDMTVKKPIKELTKSTMQIRILDKNNRTSIINNPIYTASKPTYEMKIQSALATSILQLRNGIITRTKSLDSFKPKQMVSVLKKSPLVMIPQKIPGTNLMESIVTTINSSNDQVRNIIVQDNADAELPEEVIRKPPRKKLNLAEYRSRREQNRSTGSRINSPAQPMTLVYIHHVSTNTEPINSDSENPIWSEREIVSILKSKTEMEEENVKPKRATREKGMQTTETFCGIVYDEKEKIQKHVIEQNSEKQEKEKKSIKDSKTQVKHLRDEVSLLEKGLEEGVEIECCEISNTTLVNSLVKNKNISDNHIEVFNDKVINEEVIQHSTSISRMRDLKHRNYRPQLRASSASSQSPSRSHSHVRAGRTMCRSRQGTKSEVENYSRSRSRSYSRSGSRDRNRSHSRASSFNRSRSRSKSRSRSRRHPRRRRRISHRRSSVSSSSTWSSRSWSRSRSSSSRRYKSFSRSISRSRSRSSRYSSCSRSSSRSNFGRPKWSNHRRKGGQGQMRSYDRHRCHSASSSHGYNDWKRSPLSSYRRPYDEWHIKEKQRQVEERRVIYVGRLKEGITKAELRRRFEAFGPIVDISVHFREHGHNYGFVTFAHKNDAYEAVEHGNDDSTLPTYDLCFGGRRAFCKVKYADLDGAASNQLGSSGRSIFRPEEENTFDLLLKEAQAKLRKRKV